MISESHKFIFIHVQKTGGNSVQDALRQYASDEFLSEEDIHDGIEDFGVRNLKFKKELKKHSTLQDYYDALGNDLDKFQIVTTIRNPFDRIVSFYFSPNRGDIKWNPKHFKRFARNRESLDEILKLKENRPFSRSRVAIDRVDRFLKFENLHSDFERFTTAIGIKNVQLPHRNRSKNRRDYRDCFDDELREFVFKKHQFEIELGDYEF